MLSFLFTRRRISRCEGAAPGPRRPQARLSIRPARGEEEPEGPARPPPASRPPASSLPPGPPPSGQPAAPSRGPKSERAAWAPRVPARLRLSLRRSGRALAGRGVRLTLLGARRETLRCCPPTSDGPAVNRGALVFLSFFKLDSAGAGAPRYAGSRRRPSKLAALPTPPPPPRPQPPPAREPGGGQCVRNCLLRETVRC